MGSFRQTPAPILFLGLKRDAFAGELVVETAGRRVFQWRAGAPIGLVSDAAGESLAGYLARCRPRYRRVVEGELVDEVCEAYGKPVLATSTGEENRWTVHDPL